ncbi:hypothetical protein EDB83DRAFT_239322 [Lactarius deliciosus]|nr:hypothetical protein EDB83DRAFT_239322 [Lactarius deliciosus]
MLNPHHMLGDHRAIGNMCRGEARKACRSENKDSTDGDVLDVDSVMTQPAQEKSSCGTSMAHLMEVHGTNRYCRRRKPAAIASHFSYVATRMCCLFWRTISPGNLSSIFGPGPSKLFDVEICRAILDAFTPRLRVQAQASSPNPGPTANKGSTLAGLRNPPNPLEKYSESPEEVEHSAPARYLGDTASPWKDFGSLRETASGPDHPLTRLGP